MSSEKTLQLQPFTWEVVDEHGQDGSVQIQCWAFEHGHQRKINLLRIEDYPATCFIELPTSIDNRHVYWESENISSFVQALIKKLKSNNSLLDYNFVMKPRYYFYKNEMKYPMLHLTFRNIKAMEECCRLFSRPYYFPGLGRAKVRVYEDKIPYLRKLLTRVKVEAAQWFQVKAKEVPAEEKISTVDEYIASWKDIKPLDNKTTETWRVHPKVLVFDIEAYSKNKKAFPSELNTSDACFMISIIVQNIGLPETRKRYLVIFGECHDIQNAEVISTSSEIECINKFEEIIKEVDPDIISGYHIHGFDNKYLNTRLERVMCDWMNISRLVDGKVEIGTKTWSSAAYGHNEVNILKMSGRISIDMLPVVKRDYKLPRYDLDTVGKFFLGRGKHPVKAEEIFTAYEDYWNKLASYEENRTEESYKAYQEAIDLMTKVAKYCLEDAELTLDISEKVHIWIASVELSNIVGVQIMELYTRGQQIRCLSKIYDEAHRSGYVIDYQEPLNIVFNGGAVEKPKPGVYDEVPFYDVNSMYPNIMIRYNICHTTYINDDDPETKASIKDEDCNIIEFDQFERPKKTSDKLHDDDFDPEMELGKEGKLVHRKIRFIKASIREGIIPRILKGLLAARKEVKNQIKELEKAREKGVKIDPVLLVILDRRQLAIKCSANSYFGFLGAIVGRLPLIQAAMAVTAKGREIVTEYKKYLVAKYAAIIVYGDTDSVAPKFEHIKNWAWKDKWAFWKRINDELSGMYDGITLEMEKVTRIICFAPKMYAYLTYNEEGKLMDNANKISPKGIVLARRDGTPWVRNHYRNILFNILYNYSPDLNVQAQSMITCFNMIVDAALELQAGKVNWENLAKINEMGSNYKNPSFPMAVLAARLRSIGRPAQPGDRIRYLICNIPNEKSVGNKMRTDDEYVESQETDNPLTLDVNYYLENALLKKIDPLFQVGFNKILPLLTDIGYKPNSRKHFVDVSNPVKMIVRAIEDGHDITQLKEWFKGHVDNAMINSNKPVKRTIVVRKTIVKKRKEEKKTLLLE